MLRYFGKRLIEIVPLIFVVSLICFALMQATPGGPTAMLSQNPMVKPADLARIRANFGIDEPVIVQYCMWLKRVVLHGDFGNSYVTGEPVSEMIRQRMPATLELMGSAFLLAFLFGISGGIFAALKRYTKLDSVITLFALVGISIPIFWMGLMSMMLFTVKFRLLPSAGMFSLGEPFSIFDHLRHLLMPSLVLSLLFVASWSRYMRASLSEVLQMNYIDVARAKGASRGSVIFKHAIRNAAIPVLNGDRTQPARAVYRFDHYRDDLSRGPGWADFSTTDCSAGLHEAHGDYFYRVNTDRFSKPGRRHDLWHTRPPH